MKGDPSELSGSYAQLRESVWSESVAEDVPVEAPPEMALQSLWQAGLLGREWKTADGRTVRMLDFGVWNRGAGPDFLGAIMEFDGSRVQGDVELDRCPEDWERHGHGVSERFGGVVLHVAFARPGKVWFTRDSSHREIPLVVIEARAWIEAMGLPEVCRPAHADLCRAPLECMPFGDVVAFLQAAAAFRSSRKRKLFGRKAAAVGRDQAWFEAWAGTLGYRVNKEAMSLLARRAPLAALRGREEAVLFGTAGFLVPVLPGRCDEETRSYHSRIWQEWWPQRDEFELAGERRLPWVYAGIRPANHPHRRLAALCVTVADWKTFSSLLEARHMRRLEKFLAGLEHPYWSRRISLPSSPLGGKLVLAGKERIRDFLVNHVLPCDDVPEAWSAYLRLPGGMPSSRVQRVAERLFGSRTDAGELLKAAYAHQALLQVDEDFCSSQACEECGFPRQLQEWRG